MVGGNSSMLSSCRVRDYSIFHDEDQCRAWITVLEENLDEARSALDAILLEKSRAEGPEKVLRAWSGCQYPVG